MLKNASNFDGRCAVIIGGSSGIGEEVSRDLNNDGARSFVVARNVNELRNATKDLEHAMAIAGDITTRKGCGLIAESIRSHVNAIDFLVVSAGYFNFAEIDNISEQEWEQTVQLNLSGVFWIVQSMLPLLRRGSGKSIVLLSSILAHTGSSGAAAYTASKGGISALCRALALELADEHIRVNAVSPGHIDTPMISRFTDDDMKKQELQRLYPLGRIGTPKDVAPLVLFLLSSNSSWITGRDFVVDGGRSLTR